MKILSFGAGMQSTALALMSCENASAIAKGDEPAWPLVPIYDLVVFCDLGFEPSWVMRQAGFVRDACEKVGIRYEQLDSPLYEDLMQNFGKKGGQHPMVDAQGKRTQGEDAPKLYD